MKSHQFAIIEKPHSSLTRPLFLHPGPPRIQWREGGPRGAGWEGMNSGVFSCYLELYMHDSAMPGAISDCNRKYMGLGKGLFYNRVVSLWFGLCLFLLWNQMVCSFLFPTGLSRRAGPTGKQRTKRRKGEHQTDRRVWNQQRDRFPDCTVLLTREVKEAVASLGLQDTL